MRIALVTCRELPDLDPDDRPLIAAFAGRGVAATVAAWDDPAVDWSRFDRVLLRSPWDYTRAAGRFLSWAESVPRLLNPAAAVRWNVDKAYLRDLAAAGVPTVPTAFAAPGEPWESPAVPFVVKPSVGAGSKGASRYEAGGADAAAAHVARLHRAGKTAMIQPYLDGVDEHGEADLVFIGGAFSHAARKGPMLTGEARPENSLFFEEDIRPITATAEQRRVAEAALAAVPAEGLLYARVDLLPTAGGPVVIEVELIEPSLFFKFGDGAVERYVEAALSDADAWAARPPQ